MGDAFWLRASTDAESIDVRRRHTRVNLKETLQAAVRSIVRQAAQLGEAIAQPFPLWPGPLCDVLSHGLRPGKDLFHLMISRFPEFQPAKVNSSVTTSAKVAPIVAAALKLQPPKALAAPPILQGSLIEDASDMVDKTIINGDVTGAFLTQARRVLPLQSGSAAKCLALVAISLNLSFLSTLLAPVFSNAELRAAYYEDWAFMRDADDVLLLAAMLHTLDPIDFAISPAPDRIALYLAPPAAAAPTTSTDDEPVAQAAPQAPRRRAKKKIATIVDSSEEARRREEEEEEREAQELREAQERELLLRNEAARAALLENARREEVKRQEEMRKKEIARQEEEKAKRETERRQREDQERERRRREDEERDKREEELRRLLAEQMRRNDELLQERMTRQAEERRRQEVDDEEKRRRLKEEEEELLERRRREADELKQKETKVEKQRFLEEQSLFLLRQEILNASSAAVDRADVLSAQAQVSSGDERKSDEAESLGVIKAARVDAMRRKIAQEVEERLKKEGTGGGGGGGASVTGTSTSLVAAHIFSSSPSSSSSLVLGGSIQQQQQQQSPFIDLMQRRKEEEEEMAALRKAAELQRQVEERQRNELLLKKKIERERAEEEKRREDVRLREETQRRLEEERRQLLMKEELEREEARRQREYEEARLAALEAARSEEMKRELDRQEELRCIRLEKERAEALRVQQAAAAAATVRAEEEAQMQRMREKEEVEKKAKEKEENLRSTEAGRAEALRALLSDLLAPKRPPAPPASSSPPPPPSSSIPSSTTPTCVSTPLDLSRSEPTLPSLPVPPARFVSLPLPVPSLPMLTDAPALPLASPSPPISRPTPPSAVLLPPIPTPASTLAPAAVITTNNDFFSFFEESDSGAETAPEPRGTWRTIVGSHDSSDLFASTALAAAPLLRKLERSITISSSSSSSAALRGPSPRSISPQKSPRSGGKFVWTPPRKQLYFRLESQHSAAEQGNLCFGCGQPLPSRPLLCEYTNRWFCSSCHTSAKHIIPARVLHSWDLRSYSVSNFAASFLQTIANEALMDVNAINPSLYDLAPQLSLVKAFRRKFGWMKNYVLVCRDQANLMRPFLRAGRSHLLYSTEMYSLVDFADLAAGTLLPFLEEHYQIWLVHFPKCELCRARAIVCELCRGASGLFFPWDRGVARCPKCDSFFHRSCTATRRGCPRCARDRAKRQLSLAKNGGLSS